MAMISAERGSGAVGVRDVNVSEEDEEAEQEDVDVQWERIGLDSSDEDDES